MRLFRLVLRLLTCLPLGRPRLPAVLVGVGVFAFGLVFVAVLVVFLALVEPTGRPRFLMPAEGILAGAFRKDGRPGFLDSVFAGRPRFFAGEAGGAVVVFGVVELLGGLPRPRLDGVAVAVLDFLEGMVALLGGLPRLFLTGVSAFLGGILSHDGWRLAGLNLWLLR